MRCAIEEIDLAELTAALRDRFASAMPTGYLVGRTVFRDAAAGMLGCSDLEAEDIVDTLIARGFLRYDGDPSETGDGECPWVLVSIASSGEPGQTVSAGPPGASRDGRGASGTRG